MTFPVYFYILGRSFHPHIVLETIAYIAGFQTFLLLRRRDRVPSLPVEPMLWLIVAAMFGAMFGSKILAWIESWPDYWAARHDPRTWLGGKTIVGGLLGGWAGVELVKRFLHIRGSSGDAYAFALIAGIAIGRVGCFLTGLADHTHGVATSLPWGIDFGDGLPRHPTQLYEIAFLLLLGAALWLRMRRPYSAGEPFRLFLLGYLAFRFAVEFIKPTFKPYLGLGAIQLASLAGLLICSRQLVQMIHPQRMISPTQAIAPPTSRSI